MAPGLTASTAVLMVGLALVLRDLVQRRLGKMWALSAIGLGAVLSVLLAPPALVLASAVAFLLSELADFAIYNPLQQRYLVLAVVASSLIGILINSVIILHLAFGSLDFLWGQIISKSWMVLLWIPIVSWVHQRGEEAGIALA